VRQTDGSVPEWGWHEFGPSWGNQVRSERENEGRGGKERSKLKSFSFPVEQKRIIKASSTFSSTIEDYITPG